MNFFDQIVSTLQIQQTYKIFFFGDSIVSCEWIHPNWREVVEYVIKEELAKRTGNYEKAYWNIRCFNAGFSGATSKDLLVLSKKHVLTYQPDLVFMIATGNDLETNLCKPEEHAENIKKLLTNLTERKNTQVLYATSPATGNKTYNNSYEPYVRAVEKIFPLPCISFINLFDNFLQLDLTKLYTLTSPGNEVVGIKPGELDFLHPNVEGNLIIAQHFLQEGLGVRFNPEKYLNESQVRMMCPHY